MSETQRIFDPFAERPEKIEDIIDVLLDFTQQSIPIVSLAKFGVNIANDLKRLFIERGPIMNFAENSEPFLKALYWRVNPEGYKEDVEKGKILSLTSLLKRLKLTNNNEYKHIFLEASLEELKDLPGYKYHLRRMYDARNEVHDAPCYTRKEEGDIIQSTCVVLCFALEKNMKPFETPAWLARKSMERLIDVLASPDFTDVKQATQQIGKNIEHHEDLCQIISRDAYKVIHRFLETPLTRSNLDATLASDFYHLDLAANGISYPHNEYIKLWLIGEYYRTDPTTPTLQSLLMSECNLIEVPENIGCLRGITELDLSNNRLTFLPTSFTRLDTLRKLYLQENRFTEEPAVVQLLVHLENAPFKKSSFRSIF